MRKMDRQAGVFHGEITCGSYRQARLLVWPPRARMVRNQTPELVIIVVVPISDFIPVVYQICHFDRSNRTEQLEHRKNQR